MGEGCSNLLFGIFWFVVIVPGAAAIHSALGAAALVMGLAGVCRAVWEGANAGREATERERLRVEQERLELEKERLRNGR
jgi:hypothetical protein